MKYKEIVQAKYQAKFLMEQKDKISRNLVKIIIQKKTKE